ncbi:MAG TPA: UDP-N-acetylmuramate dehydrogenase [Candidatus Saccharimonadales bacterium]|nr:UDP-N-acetylmuramate dehydrogenase [Candidatus Saccharimonadales bacterium]
MHILDNVDLRLYSTMRLGGRARWLAEAHKEQDVKHLVDWAKQKSVPFIIIGQGSNIVWRDEGFDGLIIVNQIKGIEVLADDNDGTIVRVGAGEIWDEAVAWSANRNLSGIEFLSRIPGLAGGGPVQNIGAYGAEIADVLKEVAVFDTQTDAFETVLADGCGFAYRTSRFKTADKGRFIILNITLKLKKARPAPPFYESLENYFKEHDITEFNPQVIREAVTEIRKIKLPDPSVVANNGSFFTNPIVDESKFNELKQKYPDIKGWPTKDGRVKLAAGWMVEKAGFKDTHDKQTGMATWWGSALVMVNEHAQKTADLLAFKQKVLDKVSQMFGVILEQEPELLP